MNTGLETSAFKHAMREKFHVKFRRVKNKK